MRTTFIDQLVWPDSTQGDVFFESRQQRLLGWAEGKPSLHEESTNETLAVRVLEKGAEGIVSTRQVPPQHFETLVNEAKALARVTPSDPTRRLALEDKPAIATVESDTALFQSPHEAILEQLRHLEQKILATDPRIKKIIKFQFSETRSRTLFRNTFGVRSETTSSYTQFVAEILAAHEGDTEIAWDSTAVRFGRDLQFEPMALELGQHALSALGAKPLPTGTYSVILAPRVGVQLLDLLMQALSADAVQMGRSFLGTKKDEQIGSAQLTIIDDPLLATGVASASHDDEGTPRSVLTMVENGVLRNFFYDLRTAVRDGVVSNGRGHRASVASAPKPSATNFFIKPGTTDSNQLLRQVSSVFVIRDVMGLHMADPITGEFSLGASGLLYKNGKPISAVRGVTMAGSVSDLMRRIQTVGNDFRWYGSVGCPSLFIESMSIAGA